MVKLRKTMKKLIFILLMYTYCLTNIALSAPLSTLFPVNSKRAFSRVMTRHCHLNQKYVQHTLKSIRYNPDVIKSITHPAEKKSWNWYKKHFITNKRIKNGLRYWHKHKQALNYARRHYGINPSIIVAIIGIETQYGKKQGRYFILNALGTLAFHYPPRTKFFQTELANYLIIASQHRWGNIHSSYAGAFGIPQFMPNSYRQFGVSYQKKRSPDLIYNNRDAILSIANFLNKKGWNRNQYIVLDIKRPSNVTFSQLIQHPKQSLAWYQKHRIITHAHANPNTPVRLISLSSQTTEQHWLALPNFECIMHYNPRIKYAMAVYTLSRILQHEIHHERRYR